MKLFGVTVGVSVVSLSFAAGCATSPGVTSSGEAGAADATSSSGGGSGSGSSSGSSGGSSSGSASGSGSSSGGGSTGGGADGGDATTVAASDGGPDSTAAADASAEAGDSGQDAAGSAEDAAGTTDAPADAAADVYDGGSVSACVPFGEGSSADGGIAASCAQGAPGTTNCGAASESCCTSLEVPGGSYYRTYDDDDGTLAADGGPTALADPATISQFRLDKYDVTVGRFRQFVNAVLPADGGTGFLPAAGSGIHTHLNGGLGLIDVGAPPDAGTVYETGWSPGWDSYIAPTNANLACSLEDETWTSTAGTQENLPINCVNWYEAYAFCIWDGGFLPSEAEWEYAAAGGSQQREYPWGSTPPGTANQYAIYGCTYPYGSTGTTGCTGPVADIAPVGTATQGAGLWCQLDLEGDMFQWNLDRVASYVDPCADCAYLTQALSDGRDLAGGPFEGPPSLLFPPVINGDTPTERYFTYGFRCARSP